MNSFKLILLEERIVLDAAAVAHVIYVNAQAAPGGDGSSWAHAYTNLQDGLAAAAATTGSDQIWIAKGTYTAGASRTDSFNVPDQTSLYGGFKGTESMLSQRNSTKNLTVLSGDIGVTNVNTDNTYTIVKLSGVTATLDGLLVVGAHNDSTGLGGGLSVTGGSTLTLSKMTFMNDFASVQGGGVYASGVLSLSVLNSSFIGNESVRGGGLRSVNNASVTISGTDFNGNHALIGGGFYSQADTSLSVTSSTFENNVADANGSSFRIAQDQNATISKSIMKNEIGPIVISLSTNVTLTYNLFDNVSSTADQGNDGGLFTSSNQNVTVSNNIIRNNVGFGEGTTGGFTSESDVNAVITNNLFQNNSTQDDNGLGLGGALAVLDQSATISGNIFINNSADYGAAIFALTNDQLTITKNVFTGNTATAAGGALSLGITNPIFADIFGPGDNNVTISQNVFSHNSSGDLGGAIASGQETNLVIDHNAFSFNSAARGGAIGDLSSTTLAITANSFLKNAAAQGKSVWLDGGQTTVNGVSSPGDIIDELTSDNFGLLSNDIYIA
ncbi:MAG: right-handed parallel beta-helix repeat-containing protein [Parachlamydia sp.]|nr:right-handed parallel beta-helix repeat-containing protein [Parachlamydia sp.]